MKRIANYIGLIVLIILVVLGYFYFVEPGQLQFHNNLGTSTSTGLIEANNEIISAEHNTVLYTWWVFMGLFILIFLKIGWKVIIYNWILDRSENKYQSYEKYKPSR